ncbi:lysin B [Mycobacterium phage Nicholas]|uniref:Lysin B n=1 Tax=Mycobacterium phage Lumos TaxID=1701852 RepID=A0A0K2CM69_9CAUD|nr:lysin B [Mycobacterium phage Snenia]YP_010012486.1 lysin B [Mycobacterium phage Lumos]ASM62766.1 lysin B [Mycobacterium phage Clautastrophe]ASR86958.1 lysin B [Mycobacterium phage Kingsolomon]ASR87300.1 lysin B [Mycobacterium phage Nicholas]AYB70383.1 lysin B [Mycobacterium phage Samty]QDF16613.1 lysin B [Mycobacterium phage MsGreen]QDK03561.1 lysin B [Mycobacterium phage Finnry]QPL14912.1 lysin B [Mycobacterium phage Jubie]QZD99218.1 lysin B [Mycobacterium phage Moostard]
MPLRLGDRNESVRQWRVKMNAWFGGLYTRLHGPLPMDTDEFGPRAKAWQEEYERRTGQVVDGVVSDNDLNALKVPLPAVVGPSIIHFSINGAGSTWDMGYPYDIGELLDKRKCYHQPVGYDTSPVPMSRGVKTGVEEFIRLLRLHNCQVVPWCFTAYSMGAIVAMTVLMRVLYGDLQEFKATYKGSNAFGNPMRQNGHTFPGCAYSDGEGIVLPNAHDTPVEHWDFTSDKRMVGAKGDDLYSSFAKPGSSADQNENMRAVWDIVNTGNPLNLGKQVLELVLSPTWHEAQGAFAAAWDAIVFFIAKGTSPHTTYQFIKPIPGDPRDCWQIALNHMQDIVASVPWRAAA